jgi:hypothetical protein
LPVARRETIDLTIGPPASVKWRELTRSGRDRSVVVHREL